MQAYSGLPILTNQPAQPTRLVGIWPLRHEGSVGEYQRLAHAAVDEFLAAGRTPIVAGGTGLYLRAALADLELPPAPRLGARERWEALYDEAGPPAAHASSRRTRPSGGRFDPPERPPPCRPRSRACGGGSVPVPGQKAASGPTTRATPRSSSAWMFLLTH